MNSFDHRLAQRAQLLERRLVEKVWGRHILPPPFVAPQDRPIGEIWFDPIPQCDRLLIKYLFTSEKLSVQVHPSDRTAQIGEAGKEECWLVLDAAPGAQLALGFCDEFKPQQIADAARNGTIEQMLTWHDARVGDVFFLPGGTVHAIGPGLVMVEVQQHSDTTFRLYDYGRPRELHLERALAVANCGPMHSQHHQTVGSVSQTLIEAEHFRLDRVVRRPDAVLAAAYPGGVLALPLEGEVIAKTAGDRPSVRAKIGDCLYSPSFDLLDFSAAEITLLSWMR
ncbi:MAG: class I mannose-6-phosphate isomerase [Pseudomonadota bacterium]